MTVIPYGSTYQSDTFRVTNGAGTLVDPAAITAVIVLPDGATASPAPTLNPLGVGEYAFEWLGVGDQLQAGPHQGYVEASGGGLGSLVLRWMLDWEVADPIPARSYASLTKLKAYVGISASDTTRDDQLQDCLNAATGAIDDYCRRSFHPATGTPSARILNPRGRVLRTGEGQELIVPDIGSLTGLVVETGNATVGWTVVPAASIEAQPVEALDDGEPVTSLLWISGCWPTTPAHRARVTADWDWPATPAVVEEACRIQAGRLWKRKDSPEGVLGSAEWGVIRLSRVDPDVQSLLARYRVLSPDS